MPETKAPDDQGQQGDQGTKAADDKTPTMADVRREIREEIEAALAPVKDLLTGKSSAGGPDPAAPSGGDPPAGQNLGAMVDAALAKVLGDRDRKSADDEHKAQHAAIAAAAEVQPVDRPRRSRWLGNIWDDRK